MLSIDISNPVSLSSEMFYVSRWILSSAVRYVRGIRWNEQCVQFFRDFPMLPEIWQASDVSNAEL